MTDKHEVRILGKGHASLPSPPQGLGCMGLSAFYGSRNDLSDEEAISFIRNALDHGITHLDTSDVYGPHTNEVLVGKAIKGYARDKILLATKFGISFTQDGKPQVRGDREYVRQSVLASLGRLGVDYIDLYYVHRIDQTVPIEETIEELALLVKEGKIRHIGLSEASPETVRRAHAIHPITAVQLEWSLWSRDVEEDLIPVLRELGIGIVAYSPLGRGFLTGTIQKGSDLSETDWRKRTPRFSDKAIESNQSLVETLKLIANEKGVTPGQIAIAWLQHQGNDVVPIPGTTKTKHFLENVEALKIKLSPEELKVIGQAIPLEKVDGERYEGGSPYRNDKNPKRVPK
jgi:aryl-alcohol dehydrogenase-like predicted oxidoreductase